jgi:hypothetical protein
MEAAYSFEMFVFSWSALWILHCPVLLYRYTPSVHLWQVTGWTVPLCLSLSGFLQPTILHGAPPLVLFLASHPGVLPKYLQSLRYFVTGAAPLGGLDIERFLKRAEPSTAFLQGRVHTLYRTNIVICFQSALVVLMWPVSKPTSTAGSEKRYSSITIITLYMMYPKTRTVVKVSVVEVCRCMAWRCVTIYIYMYTWTVKLGMRCKWVISFEPHPFYPLEKAVVTHWTGVLSERSFVQGVRIGACSHHHVSRRSHFFIWVGMKVNSKFLGTSHIIMLATYPTQAVLHTGMLLHSKYCTSLQCARFGMRLSNFIWGRYNSEWHLSEMTVCRQQLWTVYCRSASKLPGR